MQFKHPELLYALFLLLIPIIVHLFQLRKFQKEDFTNVAFLKEVTIQTRKSSQLKKWLTLLTRLLLLAAIILAFAQPFTAKTNTFNKEKETVVYLDNSFSMQAKGNQGELLKRAIQDLISNVPENQKLSLFTNDATFRNTTIKALKNDLLQLNYSAKPIDNNAALLKAKTLFSKNTGTLKDFIIISDFQQINGSFQNEIDSLTHILAVKLQPVTTNNIALDSAYISKTTASNIELTVSLSNSGNDIDNLPISLFNNDELIAKTSVAIGKTAQTTFTLPTNSVVNGKISIEDTGLQYDNSLFFNINSTPKINVLAISNQSVEFLKRIFTEDEFNFTSTVPNQLNYNSIDSQNLIVLNELENVPTSLAAALKTYTEQDGYVVVIPAENTDAASYNLLLNNFNMSFTDFIEAEKHITTINFAHPLYNQGVFEKEVKNFQYPQTSTFYNINSGNTPILQFEDGKPFLTLNKNAYVFASALNEDNSNFKSSPLIVPTLYNMAKRSLKIPVLYYTIGNEANFDVIVQLNQDDILTLQQGTISLIPKQQYFNNKVSINTLERPSVSGIYNIKNKEETLQHISYNYNRNESVLVYQDITNTNHITVSNSITNTFDTIKSEANVNALWKWFAIFALVLLIIEMLILKYFK
ncbi:BatA domain-containing protein [Flavobacteriaceae bacterium XHP0103]|uniref:BatA domain-containing protein n=1 Tax=Marixanthotalea marina TaxID=2844359 RepID=UPI002989E5BF|nr:BatA domain-containing protein [Marixanthotalea marina]MBU3822580.1 BatA domain-containing protein [Marixanthotalea marina]